MMLCLAYFPELSRIAVRMRLISADRDPNLRLVKSLIDKWFIASAGMVPPRLVRHWLFLLQSDTQLTDHWGYFVRPIHYYEPLPDFRNITETQITRPREYPGIDFGWQEQIQLISQLGSAFAIELQELAALKGAAGFDFENGYFEGLDAAIYYALIRYL